jgi:hypothetical protein
VTVPPIIDARLEDLGAEQLAAMQLVRIVRVEQDQRMQVAVAGMEYVDSSAGILRFHGLDGQQHVGQRLRGMVESMHM